MSKPNTIEEFRQWYKDNHFPPESTTRFFIGRDYPYPRAFGIYMENGEYIVYKNKDDGTRVIRYHGTDEAYAVHELYDRLIREVDNQRAHGTNAVPGFRTTEPEEQYGTKSVNEPHRWEPSEQAKQRIRARKRGESHGCFTSLVLTALGVFLLFCLIMYGSAEQMAKNGSYAVAAERYARIKWIPGMSEKYNQCLQLEIETQYANGDTLYQQEAYDDAAAAYEKAGDYKDAKEKYLQSMYKAAEQMLANGDFTAAAEKYKLASDYPGAAEKAELCTVVNGNAQVVVDSVQYVHIVDGTKEDSQQTGWYRYQTYDGPACDMLGNPYAQEDMKGGYIRLNEEQEKALTASFAGNLQAVQSLSTSPVVTPAAASNVSTIFRGSAQSEPYSPGNHDTDTYADGVDTDSGWDSGDTDFSSDW